MRPPCPAGSCRCRVPAPKLASPQLNAKLSTTGPHCSAKRVSAAVRRHAPQRAATLDSGARETKESAAARPSEEVASVSTRDGGASDTAAACDDTVMVTFRYPGALEGQEVAVIGLAREHCHSACALPACQLPLLQLDSMRMHVAPVHT